MENSPIIIRASSFWKMIENKMSKIDIDFKSFQAIVYKKYKFVHKMLPVISEVPFLDD